MWNFDEIIDRRDSGCVKYEGLQKLFGRTDLLPLWVADMDFATPPFIIEAMKKRLEHPVFGYTVVPPDYWKVVSRWIEEHHQWKVEEQWMRFIPGIVKGIGLVVNVFTQPGDKVIVMPPVYHPFFLTPRGNKRQVVWNPLIRHDDGSYSIDFEQLALICDEHCKLLILCNPHNPAGIEWDRATLIRLAEFCQQHHLIVISDEIHCDMALFGHKHIPFASVSEQARDISITFQAPSKTFNMAGIVSSYAVIPNEDLRKTFFGWLDANEISSPDIFAPIATMAAYQQGEAWRKELVKYIEGNVMFTENFCREHIPAVRPLRPQASFLVWLNCRDLNLSHDELVDLFVNKAHLALNDGKMFGPGGDGFMRLNVGCPRAELEQALTQLYAAVRQLS
ncbi:MAG: PatB family C-S lyase [Prevotella sp.]|nr:PatB family C-S lyase [Prevotella sp.]